MAGGQCGDSADTVWRWTSTSGDEHTMTKVEVDNLDGEVGREALIAELDKIGPLSSARHSVAASTSQANAIAAPTREGP